MREEKEEEIVLLDIKNDSQDDTLELLSNYSEEELKNDIHEIEMNIIDENTNLLGESNEDEDLSNNIVNNNNDTENKNSNVQALYKKDRQYWVDALRILASYMVVLVHSSSYGIFNVTVFSLQWYGLMFWDAMCRSCVPIFIMISGIFFLNPDKELFVSKLYKKYIYRLVKVIIAWNIFYATVVKYLVNGFNIEYHWGMNVITDFIPDFFNGKFHVWYLYMCLGLYLVTPIFRMITQNKEVTKYFLILGFIISQIIPFINSLLKHTFPDSYIKYATNIVDKLMIYSAYGYPLYYVLGYYLSQIEIKNKLLLFSIYAIGVFNLLFTYIIKMILSIYNQEEVVDYGDYNSFNVALVSIAIFIFFKHTGKKILDRLLQFPKFKSLLLTLSSLTFGIYLIHVFYFELFYRINFHSYTFISFIFSPIHAFTIWICGAITIYYVKKIPFLSQFV